MNSENQATAPPSRKRRSPLVQALIFWPFMVRGLKPQAHLDAEAPRCLIRPEALPATPSLPEALCHAHRLGLGQVDRYLSLLNCGNAEVVLSRAWEVDWLARCCEDLSSWSSQQRRFAGKASWVQWDCEPRDMARHDAKALHQL